MISWNKLVSSICWGLCYLFPSRARVVPHSEDPDKPLLLQFMIWKYRLYLQHFLTPEAWGQFHLHRWFRMRSLVLSGHFTEERATGKDRWITHRRFSTYAMNRSVIHRVDEWSPECWTLFYMSRAKSDDWGYFLRDGCTGELSAMVPWREWIKKRVTALETGEITP